MMTQNVTSTFESWLKQPAGQQGDPVVGVIDRILLGAQRFSASDVHFQPSRDAVEVRLRLDGVLHVFGTLPLENAQQIAARLKVLAGLLTYKVDTPQEGRVRAGKIEGLDREMRISTAPTLYGERVVVRFFASSATHHTLASLGFDQPIQDQLQKALQRRHGAMLITGPSGSGKTTTAYALLRELVEQSTDMIDGVRSIVSLEDPVEHAIDGVAQMEVSSRPDDAAGDDRSRSMPLGKMLRYMMRQDPEILMIGEIRDRNTADAAMQAALTGHLLISTFHAGSAEDAVGRFLELGIEPFVLRSSLSFVLCQRLVRTLCHCRTKTAGRLELRLHDESFQLQQYFEPAGCPDCGGAGFIGRIPVAEILPLDDETVIHAILDRQSTAAIRRLAREHGMETISESVQRLIESGVTSPLEAKRVLG